MGESSKFPKSWTLEILNLKLADAYKTNNSKFIWSVCLANQKINQRIYYELPNSAFWGSAVAQW